MADEINVPIKSTYDDKGAKAAITDAQKIEKANPKLTISADDKKASGTIKDFIKSVDKIDGETATLALAVKGADVQAQLGDVLQEISKLDATDATIDVKLQEAAGLKSDLDEIETKVRELNKTPVDIDTHGSVENLGKVHAEAGQTAETFQRGIGPLRGFTDELGGTSQVAGTMTNAFIDAGEAVQVFGSQLGLSESALGAVSGVVAGIGIAVGVAVAAWSAYTAKTKETAKVTKELTDNLSENLGITEKLRAGTDEASDAYSALADAMSDDAIKKSSESLSKFHKGAKDIVPTLLDIDNNAEGAFKQLLAGVGITGDLADAVAHAVNTTESWGDAWSTLQGEGFSKEQLNNVKQYGKALEELNDQQQSNQFQKSANDILQQAAALDTSEGAAARAALADDTLSTSVDKLQAFHKTLKANADGAAEATKNFTKSQEELQIAVDDASQALEDETQAMLDQLEASKSGADMGFALEKAEKDLAKAHEETATALKEHGKTSAEYADAVDNERDAAIAAAKAQQGYREEQAKATGQTLTATQKVDGMNASLEEMASKAAPDAQAGVYNYLIQLNHIPEEKQTDIYAAVAAGDLATANRLINEASRDRDTAINVDANTRPAMAKIVALGAFIRQQFANMPNVPILDAGGVAGPMGAIAGEQGPEILNDKVVTTGPVMVPPGTRVTSRKRTEQILRSHGGQGFRYASAPAPGPVTVNVNLPAGSKGVDVVRQVAGQTRRNGRRYGGQQVVNFARK